MKYALYHFKKLLWILALCMIAYKIAIIGLGSIPTTFTGVKVKNIYSYTINKTKTLYAFETSEGFMYKYVIPKTKQEKFFKSLKENKRANQTFEITATGYTDELEILNLNINQNGTNFLYSINTD